MNELTKRVITLTSDLGGRTPQLIEGGSEERVERERRMEELGGESN